jgi:hypothetical protein
MGQALRIDESMPVTLLVYPDFKRPSPQTHQLFHLTSPLLRIAVNEPTAMT